MILLSAHHPFQSFRENTATAATTAAAAAADQDYNNYFLPWESLCNELHGYQVQCDSSSSNTPLSKENFEHI